MRIFCIAAIALTAAACAVMEAPSGGPEDTTPPAISRIDPEPGSSGVDRNTSVKVVFSEKVDPGSFRDRVLVFPPLEFDRVRVDGERLVIGFKETLPETTLTVVIRGGYTDLRRVRNDRSRVFHFSTAAAIDTGTISGRIMFKMTPDSTGLAHLIRIAPCDTLTDPVAASPARLAFAGPDGSFSFRALPTREARFLLWAFSDRNRDGSYSPRDEFALLLPDTMVLTPERTQIAGLTVNIIDPDEPGSIAGTVINLTGISMAPTVRFDGLADERYAVAVADSATGSFRITTIAPGRYVWSAFMDVSADSMAGTYIDPIDSVTVRREPSWTSPDTLTVRPGEMKALAPVRLMGEREHGN